MMEDHQSFDSRFQLDARADEEFEEYFSTILGSYSNAIFVATGADSVVGYTIVAEMENPAVFELKKYGFLCEISVDPGFAGRGVGRILFDRARRWFKRRGLEVIQLNVSRKNEPGLRFYSQLGFRPFLDILWLDLQSPKNK